MALKRMLYSKCKITCKQRRKVYVSIYKKVFMRYSRYELLRENAAKMRLGLAFLENCVIITNQEKGEV